MRKLSCDFNYVTNQVIQFSKFHKEKKKVTIVFNRMLSRFENEILVAQIIIKRLLTCLNPLDMLNVCLSY